MLLRRSRLYQSCSAVEEKEEEEEGEGGGGEEEEEEDRVVQRSLDTRCLIAVPTVT
jgi:hypothetical protein